MKLISTSFVLFFAFAIPAFAHGPSEVVRACVKDARQDYRDDIRDANEELRLSSATCRFGPVVGACMGNCFQDFKTCLAPIRDSLSSCRKTCWTNFEAARQAAKDSTACSPSCGTNVAYQTAVIQARLAFHSCHITCRSTPQSVSARAACRTTHSACVKSCRSAQ